MLKKLWEKYGGLVKGLAVAGVVGVVAYNAAMMIAGKDPSPQEQQLELYGGIMHPRNPIEVIKLIGDSPDKIKAIHYHLATGAPFPARVAVEAFEELKGNRRSSWAVLDEELYKEVREAVKTTNANLSKEHKGQLPETYEPLQGNTGTVTTGSESTDHGSSGGSMWGPLLLITVMMVGSQMLGSWFTRRNGGLGGQGDVAKSKVKKFEPEAGPTVSFADVAGCDEAKEDLQLIVEYLRDPSEVAELGGAIPKGVLLVGPPGTGKTLLAKAVAGEAGVPFFSISASEFVEMFVGVGAARVRDMFQTIRKSLPAILFIDEIDAVAKVRGTGIGGGNDEREQTINQLLVEMDGFEGSTGLIVFAATNRPDVLDPAFLRPGRFGDKKITVPKPDRQGRFEILQVHARGVKLDADVDLWEVSGATMGFTGADLRALLKVQAPMASIKRHRWFGKLNNVLGLRAVTVNRADIDKGITHLMMGSTSESQSRRLSDGNKRLLAYHELGHGVASEALYRLSSGWDNQWGDPVQKITLIGAGGAGGFMLAAGDEDQFAQTKEWLLGRITVALAANRSEAKFLKTTSTGASNDFKQGYEIAKNMVTKWGMSALGPISVGADEGSPFLGKTMASGAGYGLGEKSSNQIDHEIAYILKTCTARADLILDKMEQFIHTMAPIMIEKETILRPEWISYWDPIWSKVEAENAAAWKALVTADRQNDLQRREKFQAQCAGIT